jgi:ArsR family transcriptional regulator
MASRSRSRPEGCCPVRPVRPLPASQQERLVAALKALADPTRLEILRLVAAQAGPVCVCDIVDRFDLAQPTISHHLKVLREAGWLATSKLGIWAFYELDPDGPAALADAAALLRPPAAGQSGFSMRRSGSRKPPGSATSIDSSGR